MNINKLIEAFDLKIISRGSADTEIEMANSIRCGMQLTGFYDHFHEKRIQIIGNAEKALLDTFTEERAFHTLKVLLTTKIPCLIVTCDLSLPEDIVEYANKEGKWILGTSEITSEFIIYQTLFLQNQLAESLHVHGVLLEVFGMGVLITGESGIGKSITAIELIRRGHQLVADDLVIIKKISSHLIVGEANDVTKNLIEARGIGIVNINSLFGKSAIRQQARIDLMIKLYKQDEELPERGLGDEIHTAALMDVEVPIIDIPVKPGQFVPTSIIEIGALNIRQNQMGYNTAKELLRAMTDH